MSINKYGGLGENLALQVEGCEFYCGIRTSHVRVNLLLQIRFYYHLRFLWRKTSWGRKHTSLRKNLLWLVKSPTSNLSRTADNGLHLNKDPCLAVGCWLNYYYIIILWKMCTKLFIYVTTTIFTGNIIKRYPVHISRVIFRVSGTCSLTTLIEARYVIGALRLVRLERIAFSTIYDVVRLK